MSTNKEKEVLLYMLDLYKDMPYLWQKDHMNYMNKEMREEGFKLLLATYKNFDEDATIKGLKKKIENMRTTYVKEVKKVIASRLTARNDGEVYVPSLWYFDALSFLDGEPRPSEDPSEDPLENADSSDNELKTIPKSISIQRKRKRHDIVLHRPEKISLSPQNYCPQNNEELEVYGRSISLQMRGLDKKQLTIAQKLVSDVIFHAKLDQLSEHSCIVLKPNETMPSSSRLYKSEYQFHATSPPSNYSSPSPSHQLQSPPHSQ